MIPPWFWIATAAGIFGAGFVMGGLTQLGAQINDLDRRLDRTRHQVPPPPPPGTKPPARPSR